MTRRSRQMWRQSNLSLDGLDWRALEILAIACAIWGVIAILYSVRVRSKRALWIFMLLPIVLGPFVHEILIIIGVLASHGKF